MQSVVHRYYDVFHATKENISALREGEEFSIYQHHNGLCILCLGPSHPIRTKSLRVIKVDFDVGSQNRAKNAVTGKRKKGGIQLHPDTAVCKVYTEPEENPAKKQKISEESTSTTQEEEPAEQVWTIRACVRGFLVEPNRSLVDNPKLLEEKPATDGYFAIIMPHRGQTKTVANHLSRQSITSSPSASVFST